ncbi:MAG: hypothetical protein IJ630_12225 [Treponema sp.]|nr:hypothetical protein [Treponema sp.]
MKKIIASLVAIAIASSVAFAEVKFSFYNKLYEDDPIAYHSDADDETVTDFPAIKERMYFEVLTDRVDAMVKATVALNDYDEKHFGLQGSLDDWYIEFRPIEILTLGMHTGIFSDGSYLPIYDDNLYAGNIGSEGFTVTLRPAKDQDLRIALTAPFSFDGSDDAKDVNWLNGNKDDGEDEEFNIGIGAIYGQDLFQIGLSLQDVIDSDERQFGAYINLPTLFGVSESLTLGAGFAHTWADYATAFNDLTAFGGIGYENLLNAYATFDLDKVSFAAELLYNLGGNDDVFLDDDGETFIGFDLYSALSVSFGLSDALTATATGKILVDMTSNGAENAYAAAFALDYDINDNNTVGVEFDFDTCDSDWAIAVPLYWKYHFDN